MCNSVTDLHDKYYSTIRRVYIKTVYINEFNIQECEFNINKNEHTDTVVIHWYRIYTAHYITEEVAHKQSTRTSTRAHVEFCWAFQITRFWRHDVRLMQITASFGEVDLVPLPSRFCLYARVRVPVQLVYGSNWKGQYNYIACDFCTHRFKGNCWQQLLLRVRDI